MLPKFVTKDFLENSLKGYLGRDINVQTFSYSNVLESSNSFCGVLVRLEVSYTTIERNEDGKLSLIAKLLPEEEIFDAFNLFPNELGVYGDVLPMVYKLDYSSRIAPKLIFHSSTPIPTLLLEDLKPIGYVMYNDGIFLNLEHCLLVIDQLAYLHAVSVALRAKNPEMFDRFSKSMYSENEFITLMITNCSTSLDDICHATPDLGKYCGKVLNKNIMKKLYATIKPSQKLNVLNHGDLHTGNIMFYYDSKRNLTDAKLIDFQFSVFGSPAIDLQYFIVMSTTTDLKTTKRDILLTHYYNQLVRNLSRLRVEFLPLTMDEFKKEFDEFSIYGYAATLISLPLFLAPVRPDATLVNFIRDQGEDCFRTSCFRNEEYINQLRVLLPMFNNLGILD